MRLTFLSMAGVAAALVLATPSAAETQMGKVVAKDPTTRTFTIETDAGERMIFTTAAGTTFEAEGQPAQLDTIDIGDRVRVTAEAAAAGEQRAATRVEVEGAASAAARDEDMGAGETAAGEEMETAAVEAEEDMDEGERVASRLPATGSPLPLIGVVGAASLGLGVALGGLRRRSR
jgi:LPXTG-motif cell wall-anchored protein